MFVYVCRAVYSFFSIRTSISNVFLRKCRRTEKYFLDIFDNDVRVRVRFIRICKCKPPSSMGFTVTPARRYGRGLPTIRHVRLVQLSSLAIHSSNLQVVYLAIFRIYVLHISYYDSYLFILSKYLEFFETKITCIRISRHRTE